MSDGSNFARKRASTWSRARSASQLRYRSSSVATSRPDTVSLLGGGGRITDGGAISPSRPKTTYTEDAPAGQPPRDPGQGSGRAVEEQEHAGNVYSEPGDVVPAGVTVMLARG